MTHRQIIILIFLFCFSIQHYGQKTYNKDFGFCPCLSGLAYNWQGTHNIDFGIQPSLLFNKKTNHDNIGLSIAANLMFYNKSTYLTPITKIRIIKHRKGKEWFGWVASIGHSYTNVQNKYDHRLTPEIGLYLTFGFSLSAGYNIPISKYQDNFTSPFRIGIRFNSH